MSTLAHKASVGFDVGIAEFASIRITPILKRIVQVVMVRIG